MQKKLSRNFKHSNSKTVKNNINANANTATTNKNNNRLQQQHILFRSNAKIDIQFIHTSFALSIPTPIPALVICVAISRPKCSDCELLPAAAIGVNVSWNCDGIVRGKNNILTKTRSVTASFVSLGTISAVVNSIAFDKLN